MFTLDMDKEVTNDLIKKTSLVGGGFITAILPLYFMMQSNATHIDQGFEKITNALTQIHEDNLKQNLKEQIIIEELKDVKERTKELEDKIQELDRHVLMSNRRRSNGS